MDVFGSAAIEKPMDVCFLSIDMEQRQGAPSFSRFLGGSSHLVDRPKRPGYRLAT